MLRLLFCIYTVRKIMNKFVIDTEAGTVLPVHMEEKEECPVMEAWHRLGDEIGGWKEYRQLETKGEKYATASKQEFMHALMALDDLLHELYKAANTEERDEMLKLKNALFTM